MDRGALISPGTHSPPSSGYVYAFRIPTIRPNSRSAKSTASAAELRNLGPALSKRVSAKWRWAEGEASGLEVMGRPDGLDGELEGRWVYLVSRVWGEGIFVVGGGGDGGGDAGLVGVAWLWLGWVVAWWGEVGGLFPAVELHVEVDGHLV